MFEEKRRKPYAPLAVIDYGNAAQLTRQSSGAVPQNPEPPAPLSPLGVFCADPANAPSAICNEG